MTPEGVCVREVAGYDIRPDNTIEALMVPWHRPVDITEFIGGQVVEYREQFAPGAFERAEQPNVAHRVTLAWGHSDDFGNAIGRGVSFHNQADGEVGVFRLNAAEAAKAREMIADMGLSVSFQSIAPVHGSERAGTLVTRKAVHLRHLAVVANPAYPDARILAIRESDEVARAAAEAAQESQLALAEALQMLRSTGAKLPAEQVAWLESVTAPAQ
jgi:HK97 family phage prohead protease